MKKLWRPEQSPSKAVMVVRCLWMNFRKSISFVIEDYDLSIILLCCFAQVKNAWQQFFRLIGLIT